MHEKAHGDISQNTRTNFETARINLKTSRIHLKKSRINLATSLLSRRGGALGIDATV